VAGGRLSRMRKPPGADPRPCQCCTQVTALGSPFRAAHYLVPASLVPSCGRLGGGVYTASVTAWSCLLQFGTQCRRILKTAAFVSGV
jgi:hypothetical protein